MNKVAIPVVKELVLIGGGHAHVGVLRYFGMHPLPGLRITLVARDIDTPYSGMLPGYIAGHYQHDACHIDLGPLARFAGARLYHARVTGLDTQHQQVLIENRPPLPYDLVSINIGSRPDLKQIAGATQHALPVKPIDRFIVGWHDLLKRIQIHAGIFHLAVVGGGAGGVELLLAVQHRIQHMLRQLGGDSEQVHFSLYTRDAELLIGHPAHVRRYFQRLLVERKISLHTQAQVEAVTADAVQISAGESYPADAVLCATQASAPDWPQTAGLAVDVIGFIRVNAHLQSVSHPTVFAAGDIASLPDARPKSGVFAVRQGMVLADNLRRALSGRTLRAYRPQKHFLSLISTGDQYAVASKNGGLMPGLIRGRWVWRWKDWIDQRFMQRFNRLPPMGLEQLPQTEIQDNTAQAVLYASSMRCGGCGAKVGANTLNRVLRRLPAEAVYGAIPADDAAVIRILPDQTLVQSVDYFRAFTDDAYTFGAIAANHALGDLYAMGVQPHTALAIATVPYAREAIVEHTLYELLAGATQVLHAAGAQLAGGHSGEGAEMAFGLTVNGLVGAEPVLGKGGMQAGDALILTKPLGTGALLAADMRGKARGHWIDQAMQHMLLSNQQAAAVLRRYGAQACTDITGFGLLGHLLEMLWASQMDAELNLACLPVLEGADAVIGQGILSSMQPENLRLRHAISNQNEASTHPLYPLLFDPQTAGGLLAALPFAQADDCVQALQDNGYPAAVMLGKVRTMREQQPGVVLRQFE